ncbi:hypothetical protein BFP70_07945 [Thioclava sp. SK-1]|nr:hypothetical protein BFP70_07945 [Thioclava sp. SK-1]
MPSDISTTYARVATQWHAQRNRSLFERPWLQRLVTGLGPGASVLDLGCGSGEPIGKWLIEQGFALTGVDIAAPMLDLARRAVPQGIWVQADMQRLDLGQRYDAIVAFNSFFHLSPKAQRQMFPIFARHLRPGGRLMFTCGPEAGEAMGAVAGQPVYHSSLSPAEYALLMEENGLLPLRFVAQDPDCRGHSLWLAQAR